MKKYISVLVFFLFFIPVSMVSANVLDDMNYERGYLYGVPTIDGNLNATDGDINTYLIVNDRAYLYEYEITLDTSIDVNKLFAYYSYRDPSLGPSAAYAVIQLQDSNNKVLYTKAILPGYTNIEKVYDVKKVLIRSNGENAISHLNILDIYDSDNPIEDPEPEDPEPEEPEDPPLVTLDNISDMHFTAKDTLVSFAYTLPDFEDFSHLVVFRNNVEITNSLTEETFMDTGLVPNKSYTYKFITVDIHGNISPGYIVTVHTDAELDTTPPAPPTGLDVSVGNQSIKLSWNRNTEPDMKGYNVYLNGIQINDTLIYSNYYVIPNLNNDEMYNLQVSAVDTSGNESALSSIVSGTPNPEAMPIFKTNYDIAAVSSGISNWFSSLWLILAFSVGIPLAFYVSHRIKALFFS